MPRRSLAEQLEEAVQAWIVRGSAPSGPRYTEIDPLVRIAGGLRDLPRAEFKADLKADLERRTKMANAAERAVSPIPAGYHTITPYLVAQDAPGLIEFVTRTFGAEETFRTIGSAGGIHAEARLGESMLMIGGGGPGLKAPGEPWRAALHVYVEDVDAAFERAVEAGGVVIDQLADQEYGERSASIQDPAGNYWYIATAKGENYIPQGLRNVNLYLHAVGAPQVIDFLREALGGEEQARYASPEGVVRHAVVRIGDSVVELGEALGKYRPMKSMAYLYVPDVDALYRRAMAAGATSISEPKDQDYGDRTAGVKDAFGNQWYLATHIKDVTI